MCVGELVGLILFVIMGAIPFATAGELVDRHCPEHRRTAVSCGLVALGWGGGLVLLVALFLMCATALSLLR